MATTPIRAADLGRQRAAITALYPTAEVVLDRRELICTVGLRPTPLSRTYTIRLTYRHGEIPHITVVEPPLERHPDARALPHVYAGDELCLFYPGEWTTDKLLARTILPWTSEWLLHYEIWLVTNDWTGGGKHPSSR